MCQKMQDKITLNIWHSIKNYKTCKKKARQNNPLSRDKAINRTKFRNDPNVRTIRQGLSNNNDYVKQSNGKVNNMYEHIENFRRNENYVKNQMEILEIKIITSEMKNSSDRLFSLYGTAEKRLSELKEKLTN